MPFITQCPHPDCDKFMLMEDEMQGTVVRCLICKRPIEFDPPEGGMPEDDIVELEAAEEPPIDSGPAFHVGKCPKCGTPLRVPRGQEKQAVQCTECDFWGLVK